jgi:putative ABC transport system permease protein
VSAVWTASRAAVRRRRLQTFVIGLVVFTSAVALVVAIGLLDASSAPYDRTFDRQRGAHVVATFDSAAPGVAGTAHRPGVEAAAGPFAETVLTAPPVTAVPPEGVSWPGPGPITVVGRADPGGPVDRVEIWQGRWVTGPGEIVLMRPPGQHYGVNEKVGNRFTVPGAPPLTIVGFASSLSQTAGAWVWPGELTVLHPTATQMLYRFTRAGSDRQVRAGLAEVTSGLPRGALLASLSYRTVKQDMTRNANAYVPFLLGFGVLGLVVAVLIVANVVSGAVVSGVRHIGVLKSLGFTPNQVAAIYLVMVLVPGVAGAALGTVLGDLAARPLLRTVFTGFGSGYFSAALSPWVDVVTLLGLPVVIVLAALVPALQARRLPAARAVTAGSAPGAGRGLRVQRRLSGTRLPRAVSLGLGLPFARPGRTGMTLMALVLGVTTVTLATGLSASIAALMDAQNAHVQTTIYVADPRARKPRLTDAQIETMLRSLPGAPQVTAMTPVQLHLAGDVRSVWCWFMRGDTEATADPLIRGRWVRGPGEVVAPTPFLREHGLAVGGRLTFELNGRRQAVTIVGETLNGNANDLEASRQTLTALGSDEPPNQYWVRLAPGADVAAYNAAAKRAEPALDPQASGGPNTVTVSIVGSSSILTLLLGTVAALGVFNTVLLTTRERRRDLGMLKSIGMTPRQVTVMMMTSMAALGVVGGLLGVPLGIAAHRVIVPAMTDAAGFGVPPAMMRVWHGGTLTALVLAGVVIAALGAYVPARSAARLTIAQVLHNE